MLSQYEGDPVTWEKPLTKSLTESGADKTPDILKAVEELRKALEGMPGGSEVMSKYNIKDCEVGIIGDNARVTGGMVIGGKK